MENFLSDIRQYLSPEDVQTEEPMSRHTSFQVGGPAKYFLVPKNSDRLAEILKLCRQYELPWMILGKGSNLLISDKGYPGVVIDTSEWKRVQVQGSVLYADAGVTLAALSRAACEASLAGLEFAAGIPGTVGGGLVMNAGAYGGEMKQVVKRATVLEPDGRVHTMTAEELELSYRHSCIPERELVVLAAEFSLSAGDRQQIRQQIQELNRRRREKQPLEYPSAGSTFKRPEGYFAGKLIQDAGLAGFQVGGAAVSKKHCGFVINQDHATASDIWELCRQVKSRVKEQFGVTLELEVKTIGEF